MSADEERPDEESDPSNVDLDETDEAEAANEDFADDGAASEEEIPASDASQVTEPEGASLAELQGRISAYPSQDIAAVPRTRLLDGAEKIVYFFALLAGGAFILLGKSYGWLSAWAAAIFAIVCIVLYAGFAWTSQRENPVRADRLGDNCYYLGLVYTLASLIASLIAIDRGADVSGLIGNFGVALVSTAAGIVTRLILIQLRAESDDVDQRARIALAQTAQAMQSDLQNSSAAFRSALISAQESFRISVQSTEENVEHASDLVERLKEFEISPEEMERTVFGAISKIEEAANSIGKVADRLEDQNRELSDAAALTERSDKALSSIYDALEKLVPAIDKHHQASQRASETMDRQSAQVEEHTRKLQSNADEARQAVEKVYKSLGELSSVIVDRVKK